MLTQPLTLPQEMSLESERDPAFMSAGGSQIVAVGAAKAVAIAVAINRAIASGGFHVHVDAT
jgi:hypothetical protein